MSDHREADMVPHVLRAMSDDLEGFFRACFLSHPSPMWIFDPETLRFALVNDAAVAFYGYSRAEFAALTLLDVRPESERALTCEIARDRKLRSQTNHWHHMRAGGECMRVATRSSDVRFGGRDMVMTIISDMSEIREAQQQAGEMRALLDSIVTHLPIGVFVKDMADDARYLLYNRTCGEIVGIDGAEVVGKTDLALFSPTQAADFRRQDFDVMDENGMISVEEMIPRPSGEKRVVRTVKRALPPPEGQKARYLLGLSEDVTELRDYQTRLAHVAMHDALTGLPNRVHFTEKAEALCRPGEARSFALALIDVDHFKVINDSMGHPAGDALLREVGARLAALKTPGGIVARLGGDEFALVAMMPPGDAGSMASDAAGRIIAAFEAPFHLDGVWEHVSASVGVALAPADGDDVNTLFRNADLALYAAKADGRATFRFYENAFRHQAERRHALTVELRRALAESEFELHFQPLLSLEDNRISGFEALIRWRHPERGLLAPGTFIGVAEEAGLISAIGEWVIREACREASAWPDTLSVAVNLSSLQFRQIGLLADVLSALNDSGLRPGRLELEVTETVLLSDNKQNIQILHALRELGVRIAMDDFGTGYSSLSNLRSFPFSKIKMDRSFTAGVETDPGSFAIARAVMGLGSGFGLVTTAEGVETKSQLARLRNMGFSEAQGFFIARPMPAAAIPGFLAGYGQAAEQARLSA